MSSICFHSLWQDDNDQLVIEMTHPGHLSFYDNFAELLIAATTPTTVNYFALWIEIDLINKRITVETG